MMRLKHLLIFTAAVLVLSCGVSAYATDPLPQKIAELRAAAEKGDAKAQTNLGRLYFCGKNVPRDYTQVVYWYRKAADQGDAEAQCVLGWCHERGKGVEKNYKQAVYWYRKAAEQGYARGQFNLGVCYACGRGVEKDYKQAVYWYSKAAEQGDARAQCNLGVAYTRGDGVPKDYKQAFHWYRKAAEQGLDEAQNRLGWCYEHGSGVKKDIAEAVRWYRKAAGQGKASAQYNLGWCYEHGSGVKKDIAEAVRWYRKAAEQGYARGQFNLGVCYACGRGVEQDYKQAVYWYRKAAEQGLDEAQYNLGWCHIRGEGVPKDDKQAVYWWRKAAEQGIAEGQYNLGLCYVLGEGVEQDYKQAVYWYRKAAEQGDARAQCNLGVAYTRGDGVPKDDKQAVYWWRKAAEQGIAEGQYNLGLCYACGRGVEQDYKQAVYWYRKAAEQGYARAQCDLGVAYIRGDGVPKDDKQAVYWWRKAAEQGDARAQCDLGVAYTRGDGVPKDDKQAVYWHREAAEQGYARAQSNLGDLYYFGGGVPKDYKQAVYWHRKAAEQGYARAQNILGAAYANGEGVSKDDKQAVYWYRKAAEQGNANAQCALGLRYKNGHGAPSDDKQAVYWWRKSAEQGHAWAQNNLGFAYTRGDGVPKDYKKAVYWLRKAAEQGLDEAQNSLGWCYERGAGVKKDIVEAVKWYRRAAEQGHPGAQFNLARCYENGLGVKRDHDEAVKWWQRSTAQSDYLVDYTLQPNGAVSLPDADARGREINPYYRLRSVLDEIGGMGRDFETIDSLLSAITPAECRVGETVVSADEIRFLILAYKLDYSVNLKQPEATKRTISELESLLGSAKIDFKKLSDLFGGVNFEALTVDIGLARARCFAIPAKADVAKIKAARTKYPKDSLEYVLLSHVLGTTFLRLGDFESAVEPLQYAYEQLPKHGRGMRAEMAAMDMSLSIAGNMLSESEWSARYRNEFAETGMKMAAGERPTQQSDAEMRREGMAQMIRLFDVPEKAWNHDSQRVFENSRSDVLSYADSDLELFFAYAVSAVIRNRHGHPAQEILPDLERAFSYRYLLWGDSAAEDAGGAPQLKRIDQRLFELKKRLLQLLAESGQPESAAYWTAKFEQTRVRRIEFDAAASSASGKKLMPLLILVSRYKEAERIDAEERAKPPADQDKRRRRRALEIKRELGKQLELAEGTLTPEELKAFNAFKSGDQASSKNRLRKLSHKLQPGIACIQFVPVGEKILVFIVVSKAEPFMTMISLKDKGYTPRRLLGKVENFRTLFQPPLSDKSQVQKELAELYALLFAELEKPLAELKVTKLVVNASGVLRYIPFAALYDGKQYLVEKYQVTNFTAATQDNLTQGAEPRRFSDMNAVVFADPDGSLQSGRAEGRNVAGLFAPRSQLFVGEKATLDEFESLLGNVNFIHLATHAELDANDPQKSYILFAGGRKWYYFDMMGFNVDKVDSIALCACSTAVSVKSNGVEIEGLASRILNTSPSGSILASFWKVDDAATAMLMGIYYQHIVDSLKKNHTLDRGGALREAQLHLLRTPATSHPYHWAAFTLFGDFR